MANARRGTGKGATGASVALQVLKMMVGENLKDAQLQQIVDKTIIQGDKDNDGKISFEEFCAMIEGTDIVRQLTLAHI